MSLRVWITGLWIGSVFAVAGCSGKTPPAETPAVASAGASAVAPGPPTGTPPASSSPTAAAVPPAVDPARPETKWIGTIPYDVFYDQPLVVASDSTPINGGSPEKSSDPAEGPPAMSEATTPAAGGQTPAESASSGSKSDWGKTIPLDLAIEAVKVARSNINANLLSIPKFNAGMDAIQRDAALMGMLAIVVSEHPEAANWKDKAKYVRDLCYEIQGKATAKGNAAHKATQELFEQVTGILDGGPPPEKESKDSQPYVETADRADMMKIIDITMNDLKANIGDAKRMKDQSADLTRQLAVMQTLGVMMSDASYDAADNPEYQGFTKNFIDGAAMGIEAVKADSFDEFQSALGKMNNSCNECHPKFRGQDDGN